MGAVHPSIAPADARTPPGRDTRRSVLMPSDPNARSTLHRSSAKAPKLERTTTPGIFKRGSSYVVVFRDPSGKQRKKFAKTMKEAKSLKAAVTTDKDRGEYREASRLTFADYAPQWIDTYQGRTSRGIRPETLDDYRRDLGLDKKNNPIGDGAIEHFGRMKLAAIEPRHVKAYAAKLKERGLRANSVRLGVATVKVLLATAFEDGLIRSNPAAGVRIAQVTEQDADAKAPKALSEPELTALLEEMPQEHRLLFQLLAQTGLRISEAIALQWSDVDFGKSRLSVKRRLYKGKLAAPKSRYGRRSVPLSRSLSQALWTAKPKSAEDGSLISLIFRNGNDSPIDTSNVFSRVLKPAAVRAGLGTTVVKNGKTKEESWVGFHTFRHTCASMLFRRGYNAKQVQHWLGHHSPAFTLATYVHLLPDDLPSPDFFDDLMPKGGASKEQAEQAEKAKVVSVDFAPTAGQLSGQPEPPRGAEIAEEQTA
jgi:integrase